MQSARNLGDLGTSHKLYCNPMQGSGSYCLPPNYQTLDQNLSSDDSSQDNRYCTQSFGGNYNTLESSTNSFSPYGSPLSEEDSHSHLHSPDNSYGSPRSASCITYDVDDLRHKLLELETMMLGPDSDILDSLDSNFQNENNQERVKQMMELIARGDLKQLVIACGKAVSDGDLRTADWLMNELRKMVSVSGSPLERLAAYMLEGLVARLSSTGGSIYKALRCKEPTSSELLSYMHILYEACPYFKFGYLSANGAIAEALKGENKVHIIDFQIAQGSQWITLIQALASRPGGPPHVRITGIDDSTSAYARNGGLHVVGQRLSKLAESFKVPFEFHAGAISGCEVDIKDLDLRPGEALAVNFAFMLHHMPDESVTTDNHRDRLIRLVKGLSPKVVTLVEQESNTNTAAFFPRFLETLSYFSAIFESIEVRLPRDCKERISVEQHCLAREVVNIIACEGAERVERHEVLGKWRARFGMAGFKSYPLSPVVNATIKNLLENYSEKYRLEEKDGALYLGWMNRILVASCAWR